MRERIHAGKLNDATALGKWGKDVRTAREMFFNRARIGVRRSDLEFRDATSAAETLPTDLEPLTNARNTVEDLKGKSTVMQKIAGQLKDAEDQTKTIRDSKSKLIN